MSGSSTALAGIDIGASGTRVSIDADGAVVRRERKIAMPLQGGRIDETRLSLIIGEILREAAAERAVTSFDRIALGIAGLPGRMDDPGELAHLIGRIVPVETVIIAADAVTAHVGALDGHEGAVVAAGTGVVALGTDFDSVWNRADAWGFLLGDEGGGAWIGMAGLRAALRAYDGRSDGSSTLLERMRAAFGDPLALVEQVYLSETPASTMADFAPAVADAARAGDPIAAAIWREAATRLADAVSAAAAEVEPLISWGGRLFDAGEIVLEPFRDAVASRAPHARMVAPSGSSEDGALLLARTSGDPRVRTHEPHMYVFDVGASTTPQHSHQREG